MPGATTAYYLTAWGFVLGHLNLVAAWLGILAGFLSGAVHGLFFHDDAWMGGYDSWRRRMMRLAHIAFFGIGFINLAFSLSAGQLPAASATTWASRLLIIGAVGMPLICYLSACRKPFRHLFAIPVVSLIAAGIIVVAGLLS